MIRSPNPIDVHVGARVRMRRMQLNISQEKLASALDLTFQQIQKYEKGLNRIGASRLATLSLVLGVSVNFFFDTPGGSLASGSEPPEPSLMDRFVTSRDGVMIVQAFARIADPLLRGAIARFVRDAGRLGDPPKPE